MKKIVIILLALVITASSLPVAACVNLDINVGAVDSARGRLFAAIVSTFIHERTGTKSIVKFYPDIKKLHRAINDKKVELIVVNIAASRSLYNLAPGFNARDDLKSSKEMYKSELGLILLPPFTAVSDDSATSSLTAPVLAKVVLEKFPALPRLLKKLIGKLDRRTTAELLALVSEKGKKPNRVAKDFLVSHRLI